MKLEFKFSFINLVAFAVMGGLFYWLCPLPASPMWRGMVCALVGVILFGMCFVVVSHHSIIRPAPAKPAEKQHKRKK